MYHHLIHNNKVISISTYGGQPVRGVAKCHPDDTMDVEFGKKLADARCNRKVSRRRLERATRKYREALEAYKRAEKYLSKMTKYKNDAIEQVETAEKCIEDLTKDL